VLCRGDEWHVLRAMPAGILGHFDENSKELKEKCELKIGKKILV
jgi:hypothetical protein